MRSPMNKTQGFIKVVLPQYVSESLPEPLEICAMTMGFMSFMKLKKIYDKSLVW